MWCCLHEFRDRGQQSERKAWRGRGHEQRIHEDEAGQRVEVRIRLLGSKDVAWGEDGPVCSFARTGQLFAPSSTNDDKTHAKEEAKKGDGGMGAIPSMACQV